MILVCNDATAWKYLYGSSKDFQDHLGVFGSFCPEHVVEKHQQDRQKLVAALGDVTIVLTPGNHHVHSDEPEIVARPVLEFLNAKLYTATERAALHSANVIDMRKVTFDQYKHLLLLQDDYISSSFQGLKDIRFNECREIHFEAYGRRYSGVIYGNTENSDTNRRFICVHDDQDNAASFLRLMSSMDTSYCLVAFDRQGRCGSSKVEGLQWYDPCEEAPTIYDIADKLRWSRFGLISHCRGAVLTSAAASAFPERITSLIYLSALTPTSEALSLPNEFLASEMHHSYIEMKKYLNDPSSKMEFSLNKFYRSANATALMRDRDIHFNADLDTKMNVRAPLCCAEETVQRSLDRVLCPVLIISPNNNQTKMLASFIEVTSGATAKIFSKNIDEVQYFEETRVTLIPVKGGRYFHVDCSEQCYAIIDRFIQQQTPVASRI